MSHKFVINFACWPIFFCLLRKKRKKTHNLIHLKNKNGEEFKLENKPK